MAKKKKPEKDFFAGRAGCESGPFAGTKGSGPGVLCTVVCEFGGGMHVQKVLIVVGKMCVKC